MTMNQAALLILVALFAAACTSDGDELTEAPTNDPSDSQEQTNPPTSDTPVVTAEAAFTVLEDLDITYAEGLAYDETATSPAAVPLKLDVYHPETSAGNRPVFMFIHGGGFTGGIKHKPEIVAMARHYASRGWVFVSIDYRTTEEMCDSEKMPLCKDKLTEMGRSNPDEITTFYNGIVPSEWVDYLREQGPANIKQLQQGIAQYAAQRDAKAALRWIVANASAYAINTDYITVGGASAGAITTLALGISNLDDFKDEISVEDDPTLETTHLDATYEVQSMVYFWGSNAKLDLFEGVYQLQQYDRYDPNDPELFLGHGTAPDRATPYSEAVEMQDIYDSMGLHSELVTLLLPDGSPAGHGAWDAEVDGKGLSELTFDFLVERQNLDLQ